ncbi:DUF2628 domain-containing protein [Teichococcus aestuarii]|uniref:DUF2628 domain-containing protein n=1 Tax=Teichococcus aestuarii TaxID=568898 RepID=UPI003618D957
MVPEGFSLVAALLPPLWFLRHGMWLVLVLYLALAVLAAVLLPGALRPYAGWAPTGWRGCTRRTCGAGRWRGAACRPPPWCWARMRNRPCCARSPRGRPWRGPRQGP